MKHLFSFFVIFAALAINWTIIEAQNVNSRPYRFGTTQELERAAKKAEADCVGKTNPTCPNLCFMKRMGQIQNKKIRPRVWTKAIELGDKKKLPREQVTKIRSCSREANRLNDECEVSRYFLRC